MAISFRDINFLFWIPFSRTLCIFKTNPHIGANHRSKHKSEDNETYSSEWVLNVKQICKALKKEDIINGTIQRYPPDGAVSC
jgi:hypothetical protein